MDTNLLGFPVFGLCYSARSHQVSDISETDQTSAGWLGIPGLPSILARATLPNLRADQSACGRCHLQRPGRWRGRRKGGRRQRRRGRCLRRIDLRSNAHVVEAHRPQLHLTKRPTGCLRIKGKGNLPFMRPQRRQMRACTRAQVGTWDLLDRPLPPRRRRRWHRAPTQQSTDPPRPSWTRTPLAESRASSTRRRRRSCSIETSSPLWAR